MNLPPSSSALPVVGGTPPDALIEALDASGSFMLLTHEQPDGDGLGSMLALRLHLLARGKDVVCVVPQGIPLKYAFLPGADAVRSEAPSGPVHCAVALDCDGERRLGAMLGPFRAAGRTVSIDHHQAQNTFADVNWCDASRAATGLMIHELLRSCSAEITREIATCLYCAIAADTGVFRFQNTSAEVLASAAELVRAGANPHDIARRASDEMPLPRARLLGRALQSLSVHPGGVFLASLGLEDFAAAAALPQHTDGIIDDLKRIAEAQVTVLLREDTPGRWKVSMRSMDRDVASVCRGLGGGGHVLAAGCELSGSREEVTRRIIDALGAGA